MWLRQCDKGVAGSAVWQSQRRFFMGTLFALMRP
jgi:hypothetical protein